jgi:hypothetical protein
VTLDPDAEREDFEHWLVAMDDVLDEFMARLPEDLRQKLDYSPESLDAIEDWLLQSYESLEAFRDSDDRVMTDGPARYIGETLRKNLGGRWTIQLDNPAFVFHRLPILTDFKGENSPLSPLTLTTASLDRRTGTYLSTIVRNIKRRTGG